VAIGRRALDILSVLAEARGRILTKDELLDAVWPGVFVEENVLQVHVAALRKALGPDAARLATIHGIGYRLELDAGGPGAVALRPGADQPDGADASLPGLQSMRSIAVLPMRLVGNSASSQAIIADALPHELIAELSRLRWLFVIARGSSFQFREPDPDIRNIGAALGARYCLTGTVEVDARQLAVTVELTDTRSLQVIWGDRFEAPLEGIHEVRSRIVADVIGNLELQIPLHEARAARFAPTEQLDAWGLYHLGLQRMFRFTRADNGAAATLFEQAVARDPLFARAHAGLSFTHFQNAFMHYEADEAGERGRARRHAELALDADGLDPFANLVMGRSLMLDKDLAASVPWIERALTLSPNYAQASYNRAFVANMMCDGAESERHTERALAQSPLDPLLYGMFAARSFSHALRGNYAEAASWSYRAAHAPNTHVMVMMIAVLCHSLAGQDAEAAKLADDVRARNPHITRADFFQSFPFENGEVRLLFSRELERCGF